MEPFTYDYAEYKNNSVIGHITVFEYGKLFSPVFHRRSPNVKRTERSVAGSEFIDRPKLISKLHHLLNIHRSQRKRNVKFNSKCSSKIHRALQKAIRVCFEQNIGESKLYPIGNLFLELFQCTGNSTSIFSILLDGLSVSSHVMSRDANILYPSSATKEENKKAFEYYIQHVCSCDIKSNEDVTFRDFLNQEMEQFNCLTPLSAAVQKRDPDLILTLLRYGADPFLDLTDPMFEERVQDPTELLVDDLNGLYLFKNTNFNEGTKAKLATEETKVFTCLTNIQRSVISIPFTSSNHIVTSLSEEEDNSDKLQTESQLFGKKSYNLHPQILESLERSSHLKGPATLQHLCRCAIRKTLKSNKYCNILSIPKQISYLPLPNQVKNYLDLLLD